MDIQELLKKLDPWTQEEIYFYIKSLTPVEALHVALVGEAARQPYIGQVCMAWTVRNRVEDRRWPNTVQEVLCKRTHYSCFNAKGFRRDIIRSYPSQIWWLRCKYIAQGVLNGLIPDLSNGANHYWNPDLCSPSWASKMKLLDKVGDHQFAKA
jgi:N-acetylmuramoyl-L-alanine amidase